MGEAAKLQHSSLCCTFHCSDLKTSPQVLLRLAGLTVFQLHKKRDVCFWLFFDMSPLIPVLIGHFLSFLPEKSCGNAGDLPHGLFEYEGNSYLGERVYAKCNDG